MKLAALLFVPALVLTAQTPSIREIVDRFDTAQSKLETLQAPFTLTTKRAMLSTPTVHKGQLYLKYQKTFEFVHFAFQAPEDLLLHITPKALVSLNPKTKEGEMLKIGFIKNTNRRFLGLGQNLSYLSDYFDLQVVDTQPLPNAYHLGLKPRSLAMKRRYQTVDIWVDKDSWLPRQVQWTEKGGDSWLVELGTLVPNQPLPAPITGFKVPADAKLREGFSFFASTSRKS